MTDYGKRITVKILRNDTVRPQIHRAGWVMLDPWTILANGYVRVAGGRIQQVGQGICRNRGEIRDHGGGVIFPALVNAHTHLELCALKGRICTHKGFAFWVKELIDTRAMLRPDILLAASEIGILEMTASGCAAVGDISSLGLTLKAIQNAGLAGVWFRESIGDRTADAEPWESRSGDLRTSLAGHAPHTTSPEVLMEIKNRTRRRNMPFSIHLAESDEEMSFMHTATGSWNDFLRSRGIDPTSWGLPVESPVRHLQSLGILDHETILVHVLHADQADLDRIRASGAHVCLCPRSNAALHGRLPDLVKMVRTGVNLCLGTDSLASVESLSMFDEMAFTSKSFPWIAPERIFQMATLGGASALGLGKEMGTLAPDMQARMAYLDFPASRTSQIVEALVNSSLTHSPFLKPEPKAD